MTLYLGLAHAGDRGECIHDDLLRGLPQVVTVHGLEHPPSPLYFLEEDIHFSYFRFIFYDVCMESLTLKVNVILLECTHCKHAMQIHLFLMSCFNFEAYL